MPIENMPNQSLATQTSEINAKQTSPTLLEFPNKTANFPEWRLKLQSVVRERKDLKEGASTSNFPTRRRTITGQGALAMDLIERDEPLAAQNPLLELALRRIEKSREIYAGKELEKAIPARGPMLEIKPVQAKTYQFALPKQKSLVDMLPVKEPAPITEEHSTAGQSNGAPIHRTIEPDIEGIVERANTPEFINPKIERYKTNKLPQLIPAKLSSSLGRFSSYVGLSGQQEAYAAPLPATNLDGETGQLAQSEDIDDVAPMPMRFNAALFDVIIGAFLSLLLLSPFMIFGGNWFTVEGFFAFVAMCAIVLFVYLTTAIGFLGKTFGMTLFSLEMVDINDGDFPTFHQAAVSSSVYLLSLALGGIGFLAVFLNEEQRAAHDLISGTIIIREI